MKLGWVDNRLRVRYQNSSLRENGNVHEADVVRHIFVEQEALRVRARRHVEEPDSALVRELDLRRLGERGHPGAVRRPMLFSNSELERILF